MGDAKNSSKQRSIRHIFSALAGDMLDPLSIFAEEASKSPAAVSSQSPVAQPSISSQKQQRIVHAPASDFLSSIFGESTTYFNNESVPPPHDNITVAEYNNIVAENKKQVESKQHTDKMLSNSLSAISKPCASSHSDDETYLITGEETILKLCDATVVWAPAKTMTVTMHITNYRIVLIPSKSQLQYINRSKNMSIYSWLHIPLMCIDRIDREKRGNTGTKDMGKGNPNHLAMSNISTTIIITCKDIRQYRITIDSKSYIFGYKASSSDAQSGGSSVSAMPTEAMIDRTITLISRYAFPNNTKHLFAFSHYLSSEPREIPPTCFAQPFDVLEEFKRLGVTNDGQVSVHPFLRCTFVNAEYKLCPSYPQVLIVPADISDDELFVVAGFRSEQRLPALVWMGRGGGATMWRSSQPKAGVSGSCTADEHFLDLIAQSCGAAKPMLYIIDCRNMASAVANRATGAGYESATNYPNTKIEFMNIGNIHVMRDSFKALSTLVLSNGSNDVSFGKLVEDTQWLSHIRLVLKASWECAQAVHRGIPVLVHCSHGWDRTAQVCALAQLFLDPFYRTFDGFQVLVEKEWVAFGHPFRLRSAHGLDRISRHDDQTGPIFLQFLDCVWQLVHQSPHYFEFGPRYLLLLASHVYTCRFGTFLCDSELERDQMGSRQRCLDVWTYLRLSRAVLSNPLYLDPRLEDTPTAHIFLPPLSQMLRNVCLWSDYFLRWAIVPSLPTPPDKFSRVLHDESLCRPPQFSGEALVFSSSSSSAASTSTPSVPPSVVVASGDLAIHALVTSQDMWEAAYRLERERRECLERRLLSLGLSLEEPSAPSTAAVLPQPRSMDFGLGVAAFGVPLIVEEYSSQDDQTSTIGASKESSSSDLLAEIEREVRRERSDQQSSLSGHVELEVDLDSAPTAPAYAIDIAAHGLTEEETESPNLSGYDIMDHSDLAPVDSLSLVDLDAV